METVTQAQFVNDIGVRYRRIDYNHFRGANLRPHSAQYRVRRVNIVGPSHTKALFFKRGPNRRRVELLRGIVYLRGYFLLSCSS